MDELEEFMAEQSVGKPPSRSKLFTLDRETARMMVYGKASGGVKAEFLAEKRGIVVSKDTINNWAGTWRGLPAFDDWVAEGD